MSEMSLITKRYGDIVDFTSKVNNSIIVFKKKSLLSSSANREMYPNLKVNEDDVKIAKEVLLQSLINLKSLSFTSDQNIMIKNETDKREIETIIQFLKEDKPLSKTNFLMLDKIIAILDSERNVLFRKLRTVRG